MNRRELLGVAVGAGVGVGIGTAALTMQAKALATTCPHCEGYRSSLLHARDPISDSKLIYHGTTRATGYEASEAPQAVEFRHAGKLHRHDPGITRTYFSCSNGHFFYVSSTEDCPVKECFFNARWAPVQFDKDDPALHGKAEEGNKLPVPLARLRLR